MDQFDCADRALWILWINVDEHDLGPQILDLPQDGIRWADRETDTAKDSSAQVGALQSVLEQGANVEVTLVMPSEITLSENMPVRCRGKVLRVTPPSIGNKIGVAVHLENYEYLPETQVVSSTTSGDYGRISALHEHAVQDEARATHLPTSGPRGVAVP